MGKGKVWPIKLFKDPGSFYLVAPPRPNVSPFKLVPGERVRSGQVYTRKHTSLPLTFHWPGHVPHLPTGKAGKKRIFRDPGGRRQSGYWWVFSVSATLAIYRFEKPWETCRKGNIVVSLCSFKRILLIKFEMIQNNLFKKRKEFRTCLSEASYLLFTSTNHLWFPVSDEVYKKIKSIQILKIAGIWSQWW